MILRFPLGLPLTPAHNALRSVLLGLADKDRLIFAALYDGGDNRVFTLEYDEKIRESGNAGKTDAEKKAGRKKIKEALQDEKEAGRDKSETKDDEISENTELSEIGQENPEAEVPQNAFLYGVLMEAAGFLPVSTPVKQWIKKHVDFYLSCAIVEEDGSDFVYTDVKAVDYESGFTAFDAINEAIREKTGTGLDEEDYQKISYVNDINRTNEEVLYETVAGIVAASGGGDIAEGIQELIYGYQGDSESKSFNLVRDTLYSGDEKAYEISTGIAAACGDIGMALVKKAAAKTAQKAAEKAFEKELAEQMAKESKEVVEEVVKKNADDVIEEAVEVAGKNLDDIAKDSGKVLNESGTETDLFLPDEFYNKNLPNQVAPGTKYLPKDDELGNVKQIKMYDDYGREIGWVDYTNHGYGDINSPHYHTTP